jgi:hypothetical protein
VICTEHNNVAVYWNEETSRKRLLKILCLWCKVVLISHDLAGQVSFLRTGRIFFFSSHLASCGRGEAFLERGALPKCSTDNFILMFFLSRRSRTGTKLLFYFTPWRSVLLLKLTC